LHYDPIKFRLARLLRRDAFRRAFHITLDLLFLRAWFVHRELKRLLEFYGERGSVRALDAGMGFGQYSDFAMTQGAAARVVGLEIDREHLYGNPAYFARRHPLLRIAIGDVQRLPFRDETFDLIWAVDVMEHIPDDAAAFREYARVLKPGGAFLMHTPRVQTDAPAPDGSDERSGWSVGEHERDGYSDAAARSALGAAGLRVDRLVRGYGPAGRIAWTLLQRIPLTMLAASRLLLPVALLFLAVAILPALLLMTADYLKGDHPRGGSLLVVAIRE